MAWRVPGNFMASQLKLWQWYKGQLPPDGASPLSLLMIQPTAFCNIDCSYCYLPHRDQKRRFDLDLIEPLFTKLIDCGLLGRQLSVLWHAGEPLAVPLEFYQSAFERIGAITAKLSQVTQVIQTNAMLLTQAHCDLIKRFRVRMGVSIDGPEFIHDRHRRTRSGKGTFRQVMAGGELLRKNRIPFDVIAVLTNASLDYPHEIYDFFRALDVRELAFNFDEREGINTQTSFAGPEVEQRYISFFAALLGRMVHDRARMRIRELSGALGAVTASLFDQAGVSTECNPFGILSVDTAGNLATYSPELLDLSDSDQGRFTIGTVSDIDFRAIFNDAKFLRMNDAIQAGVKQCRDTCGYFRLCGGGAPSNKLAENGRFDSTETLYCRFKKQLLIDIVEDFTVSSLVHARQNRRRPGTAAASSQRAPSAHIANTVAPIQEKAQ
jgi:uncharacterized protein